MPHPLTRLSCLVVLMGCATSNAPVALRTLATQDQIQTFPAIPRDASPDQCWGTEVIPAKTAPRVVQVESIPAETDASGRITRPAIFRDELRQEVTSPAQNLWFEVPCPTDLTPAFWSSVQRALAARGLYSGPISGREDAPTRAAIAAYQDSLGLAAPALSRRAAETLGLITRRTS